MKIGIASDHRGVKRKQKLIQYLNKKGYDIVNYGTDTEASVDYPKYAFKVGEEVRDGNIDLGILICGTGIGMSIACNKVKGVRCAKIDSTNDAKYAKLHNHANVIALAANQPYFKLLDFVDEFLKQTSSTEERHLHRISMISEYEEHEC